MDSQSQSVLPRCCVCNTPLGESRNSLVMKKQWIHYSCAFGESVRNINSEREIVQVGGFIKRFLTKIFVE